MYINYTCFSYHTMATSFSHVDCDNDKEQTEFMNGEQTNEYRTVKEDIPISNTDSESSKLLF